MGIYAHVTGQGDDVVLLHGWGCDHRYMQPIVEQLNTSYTVTNVDLPGRGQSTWKDHIRHIDRIADLILPHLPQKAIYVPWSFGGLVTFSIASRYPERVQRIIGITTSPHFTEDADWPGIPKPGFKPLFSNLTTENFQTFFTQIYDAEFAGFKIKPMAYSQLINLIKTTPLASRDPSILLKGLDLCDNTDLRDAFQSLHCPVDLIFGEKDDCIPPEAPNAMKSLNKKTNIHLISGAKHLPFWTHQEEFSALLQNII